MSLLRRMRASIESLGERRPLESAMDDELAFHVEMEAAALIGQGLSEDEARRQAKLRFGGVERVKEECREALAVRWLEDLFRDVQYGWRTLSRNRGFTMIAVLTLALGIGANTAIFSVVNGVLLKPFQFGDDDRLVMIWEQNATDAVDHEECAPANFFEWVERAESFESLGYIFTWTTRSRNFMMRSGDDSSVRVRARYVSSGLFDTLGVAPLFGRGFLPDEDTLDGRRVAVLSHRFWQEQFGGDPDVLGDTIDIGETFEIVGVMPPGFRVPEDTDFWMSSSFWMTAPRLRSHSWHAVWTIGRLKPGITPAMAEAELSLIQRNIDTAHPEQPRVADAVTVVPFRDELIGTSTRPALIVLLAAVGFVLLIACANVANLTLARSSARRTELAIRSSLGAGRLRVIRQLLTESLMLSLLGAAVGVLIAIWGVDIIMTLRPDQSVASVASLRTDRFSDVSLDWTVLAFTLALSVATGVAFGLIPAIQTARIDVNSVMKEESRGGTSGRTARRFGDALIVAEVALALVLLIGAGQMLITFARMQQRNPGLDPESVLCAEIDMGIATQKYHGDGPDITDAICEQVGSLPGVASVGSAGQFPLRESAWSGTFESEGREPAGALPPVEIKVMGPGAFETLGVPLIRGRHMTPGDSQDASHVAVVNEEFVRRYFPDEEVLGQRIRYRTFLPWAEIVGVVGNMRNRRLNAEVEPEMFLSYRQSIWSGEDLGPILIVRSTVDPSELLNAIRFEIEGDDAAGMIFKDVRTVEGILAASSSRERFVAVLLGFFTAVAVLLAAVGVYGIIAYSTSQRTREIGIRVALGAQANAIRRLIVGRGLLLGLIGAGMGVAAALLLSGVISSQLHGVSEADVTMLAGAAVFLLIVIAIASYVPARAAMRIEPSTALRHG